MAAVIVVAVVVVVIEVGGGSHCSYGCGGHLGSDHYCHHHHHHGHLSLADIVFVMVLSLSLCHCGISHLCVMDQFSFSYLILSYIASYLCILSYCSLDLCIMLCMLPPLMSCSLDLSPTMMS